MEGLQAHEAIGMPERQTPAWEGSDMMENPRYEHALQLAQEIDQLLAPVATERHGYSARLAQALARSLIDQLSGLAPSSNPRGAA
jgi:hypothetical protein